MQRTRKAPVPNQDQSRIKLDRYIENEVVMISKVTTDLFLSMGKDYSNCLGLYHFYCYTGRWQKSNQPYATTKFVSQGIGWSENKVKRIKRTLRQLGLIEDVVVNEETGQHKSYIKVNFLYFPSDIDCLNLQDCPPTQKTTPSPKNNPPLPPKKDPPNALSTNRVNALSTNIFTSKSETEQNKPPDKYTDFTEWFLQAQLKAHGNRAETITPNLIAACTATLDKLVRLDGFDFEQDVISVIQWAMEDNFWSGNIFSLAPLRNKKNGSSKFKKIARAYDQRAKFIPGRSLSPLS
ncbi:hypothetical protein LCGC14_1117140, partial [marine sediment metagenome]